MFVSLDRYRQSQPRPESFRGCQGDIEHSSSAGDEPDGSNDPRNIEYIVGACLDSEIQLCSGNKIILEVEREIFG